MIVTARTSRLDGAVVAPASKSHTIRALILGALADGESVITSPLDSFDTRSAMDAVAAFGAVVRREGASLVIQGVGGRPVVPENVIDVGNSGTTLYMVLGTASLVDGMTVLTGDAQIRRRTASPLINALNGLGALVYSTRGNGCAPIVVKGPLLGGTASVEGVTSQYLSSLLMACPLASGDSEITVFGLNERPYVHMTLDWLARLGVDVAVTGDLDRISIRGGQHYHSFNRRIPGDFSSATFLICAASLAGGTVRISGLDMNDSQGDKAVVDILRRMGSEISEDDGDFVIKGGSLKGCEVDLNAIPDAIPMLSVVGCFAEGTTVLGNVPQARLKETDRIAVMAAELRKLGGDVEELSDGLVVRGGGLRGGTAHGHGDHRVVMALTIAGFLSDGPVVVDTAEAAGVTYPGFWRTMESLGAVIGQKES